MNDSDTPEIRCSLRNLSRVTEWYACWINLLCIMFIKSLIPKEKYCFLDSQCAKLFISFKPALYLKINKAYIGAYSESQDLA